MDLSGILSNCPPSALGGSNEPRELPLAFVPGEHDVIFGKGKGCFNHQGNKNFRKIIGSFLMAYSTSTSRVEKSAIVSVIIRIVRSKAGEGGFIKKDSATGLWNEVGDHLVREKVGQTIRDALHTQYRSSTKAKKTKRLDAQAEAGAILAEISNSNFEISSIIDNLKDKIGCTTNDRQLFAMFTQANLDILNELNRLYKIQGSGPSPSPTPYSCNSVPGTIAYSR